MSLTHDKTPGNEMTRWRGDTEDFSSPFFFPFEEIFFKIVVVQKRNRSIVSLV